jgi:hypothetical protein
VRIRGPILIKSDRIAVRQTIRGDDRRGGSLRRDRKSVVLPFCTTCTVTDPLVGSPDGATTVI